MQDKLQELTEKLYNEGLAKGKAEGEQLLATAHKQAEAIVEAARKEAAELKAKAEKEAEDLKKKVASDLKMASAQVLEATRHDIENLLTGKLLGSKAMEDPEFVKELIKAVATKFSTEGAQDLQIILPEKMREQMQAWVEGELSAMLGKGVSASFTKKSAGGFSIGPREGGWFISFTEETFTALFAEYLRPITRKLLFGE